MPFKKLTVIACSLFASFVVFAQDNQVSGTDKIVDTFLACDSQFFQNLAKNKKSFSDYVDLITKDNVTFIPVESIYQQDKNKIIFKKPIKYHGLTITGYQNIYIPTSLSGKYYYWGFIINNSQKEIINALKNIKWSNYNENAYIANAKIYDRTSKSPEWEDNIYSIDGVVPKLGTIEKSLYLENVDNNHNRILCSIQGDLKKDILYKDRPDIKLFDDQIKKEQQEKIEASKLKKEQEKNNPTQESSEGKSSKEGDNI